MYMFKSKTLISGKETMQAGFEEASLFKNLKTRGVMAIKRNYSRLPEHVVVSLVVVHLDLAHLHPQSLLPQPYL